MIFKIKKFMKILVTGGAGFMGGALVKVLCATCQILILISLDIPSDLSSINNEIKKFMVITFKKEHNIENRYIKQNTHFKILI